MRQLIQKVISFLCLIVDGGFHSNANVGDVPEIELPICDLMPAIINTDA